MDTQERESAMKLLKHTLLIFLLIFSLFGPSFFTINASASETSQFPVYYVRFSGTGLGIYAEPSLAGEPIALLPDGAFVHLLSGPVDFLAKIRICDTGLEGYTDMRYLKRFDAIVYDCDIYTYEEMQEDISQLQARYPKLFHVNITGQSADGRNLYELILGNSSASKSILIHAGIHAREYINPYLVMEQLEQLLECYGCGGFHGRGYQELLDGVAVHVVPMVNPDGIAVSQFGESGLRSPELVQILQVCYAYDTASGRTKSSYADYLARWKANAHGTDLNKNFIPGFGSDAKTLFPSYAGYPGAAPFTEPETLSLGAVTLLCHPSVIINYHSMGEVAYWNTKESRYTGINTEFSSYMLSLVPYKRMGSGTASGSYLDWIYSGDHPVCSITFETGNTGCPFTFEQYPKIWLQHSLVMQAAMEYAYIH